MRYLLASAFCLATAAGGYGLAAHAAVIASCGPMEGYSYFFRNEAAGNEPGWAQGPLNSTIIFLGTDKVEDVVLKSTDMVGDSWTRSASDYGAPVFEVNRFGAVRHVLIVWFEATELYALDLEKKTVSLVSQKAGLIDVTHPFVGKCE